MKEILLIVICVTHGLVIAEFIKFRKGITDNNKLIAKLRDKVTKIKPIDLIVGDGSENSGMFILEEVAASQGDSTNNLLPKESDKNG